MLKYKYILFDLDGTVSESAGGIRASLEHAIDELNMPKPCLDDYTLYIGPPLIDTFMKVCKYPESVAKEGVELYRKYYDEKGKYINKLYDGIKDVLTALKSEGARLAVCSSKYEAFAKEIVDILGVSDLFDAVCGSALDGSRKDKKDLIPYAVSSLGGTIEADRDAVVMLGDTCFDARGAAQCGVDFVGVEYGYGDVEAMKAEGAKLFARSAHDILPLLSV